jgi:hypothetical protein
MNKFIITDLVWVKDQSRNFKSLGIILDEILSLESTDNKTEHIKQYFTYKTCESKNYTLYPWYAIYVFKTNKIVVIPVTAIERYKHEQ